MLRTDYFPRVMVLIGVVLALLANGCGYKSATPIGKILNDPREYTKGPVTVSGEVVDVFSLVVVKYFTVRDATGEITVVTRRPMPRKGAKVKVTGTVNEAFSLGDKQLIVLVEEDSSDQENGAKN